MKTYLLILICTVKLQEYQYHMNRAKGFWNGAQRAVHFEDSFLLLNQKMSGIKGYMSSFIPIKAGHISNVTISFKKNGELKSSRDGFYFNLSPFKYSVMSQNLKRYTKKSFQKVMPDHSGIFVFFKGKQNIAYFGFKDKDKKQLILDETNQCQIDMNNGEIYLFIQIFLDHFKLSYHYEDEHEYRLCGDIQIKDKFFINYYPLFFARSVSGTKFDVRVNHFDVQTTQENNLVEFFDEKHHSQIPKLFKEISLLKLNKNIVEIKSTDLDRDGKMDMGKLLQMQKDVKRMIQFSNDLLAQSAEQTLEISTVSKTIEDQQQILVNSVIDHIENWLSESEQQFDSMNRDVQNMMTEMMNYNLQKIFDQLHKYVEKQKNMIMDENSSYQEYSKFAEVISKNLKMISKKNFNDIDLTSFKEYSNDSLQTHKKTVSLLYWSLLFIGLFVIFILTYILLKLNKKPKDLY